MNKMELKNFSVNARRELLKQVELRASLFGITEDTGIKLEEQFGRLMVNGKLYPINMKSAFQSLEKQLQQKGYEQVIEEIAYTWFNRIIAIRYMEVHDYLPERVNVLSSSTGRVDPDILTEYESMELSVDKVVVKKLLDSGDIEGAYRLLFIAQCNSLNKILPFMFEKIQDYTELLLPDFLLDRYSIINQLISSVSLENYMDEYGNANVEILGWLYQYYMSEKKGEVGGIKNNIVRKEDLSVVTQLFTPRWIVEYMVQNSIGRIYSEKYKSSQLSLKWNYFFESQEVEKITPDFEKLEDLKIIDPASGSGHILIYAFELLYDMYEEQGYPPRDIPKIIIKNNLYGLEIDKRSSQIANFALFMKATEKQTRFLKTSHNILPNIVEIIDAYENISIDALEYISSNQEEINSFERINSSFSNAKQYGSLITTSESLKSWIDRIEGLNHLNLDLIEQTYFEELNEKVLPILKQNELLYQKYSVIVTNPPYHNKYNTQLKKYMDTNYREYKSDLFSAFIYRCTKSILENGFIAMMTPFTWMFNASNKDLRKYIINNMSITNLVQLEYSAFKDATVPICSFILQSQTENTLGKFIILSEQRGDQSELLKNSIKEENCGYIYSKRTKEFLKIPEYPIVTTLSDGILNLIESGNLLNNIGEGKFGISTGNNELFVRKWYEINILSSSIFQKEKDSIKWFPLANGGNYRRWYGNHEDVILWQNNGKEIKKHPSSSIRNEGFYFKEGLTWTKISSSNFGVRYLPPGFIFSGTSSSFFAFNKKDEFIILAFLLSKIATNTLKKLNETMSFNIGDLMRLPVLDFSDYSRENLNRLAKENINLSKSDWDSFETSWDFKKHPLLINQSTKLSTSYKKWSENVEELINHLITNEEKINQILIEEYSLDKEITSEININDITITRITPSLGAKTFLSYYIGCLLGRYSLNVDGLAYAGGDWKNSNYSTFIPNKYGLVQFTEKEYFEHDIIARFREFLAVAYNADTVEENIQWLAEALGMKKGEDADMRLRRYFMDEFFVDHCKTYQKKPIYWLVDSGKQKGLRTLIYMHRYQPDTMATIRFEHLQETQVKYNHEIDAIDMRLVNPSLSATEKRNLDKQKIVFKKRLEELLEFDKKLAEYANAQIPIDLDDGVVANYAMFNGVLRKIK
ncbi:BREX-1 system adenine-specific DNA-methyltransferase PglX [Planomicrobium okeanokoites]|uniref:BREX-1 system adenine-specific DNA-methyltransferase PglX n=1 Tax=Planomicrobium okeanokoites TaxID=244 RepID=UPI002492BA25|nr:BREX-1 system adenine-specific DNA-methyltransferase PglX [Planomicrobium okeanokoites]